MWIGNCYDNSVIEQCFFVNMKTGTGDLGQFRTGQELADKTGAAYNVLQWEVIQLGLGGRSTKGHSEHTMHHGVA